MRNVYLATFISRRYIRMEIWVLNLYIETYVIIKQEGSVPKYSQHGNAAEKQINVHKSLLRNKTVDFHIQYAFFSFLLK